MPKLLWSSWSDDVVFEHNQAPTTGSKLYMVAPPVISKQLFFKTIVSYELWLQFTSKKAVTGHQFLPAAQSNLEPQEFCNSSHAKLFAWEVDCLRPILWLIRNFLLKGAPCLSSPSKLLSLSSRTVMSSRNQWQPIAVELSFSCWDSPLYSHYMDVIFTNSLQISEDLVNLISLLQEQLDGWSLSISCPI